MREPDEDERVTVVVTAEVAVYRPWGEEDCVTEAWVHDAISFWFEDGQEYEVRVSRGLP